MKVFYLTIFGVLVACLGHCADRSAVAKHALLQKPVDRSNVESVGRHFLHAMATGHRKRAETLMVPSKGFWAAQDPPRFPYSEEISATLLKCANGKAKVEPRPGTATTLDLGGIQIALIKKEGTESWIVHTGYLFSTRSGLEFAAGLLELKRETK